MRYKDSAKEVDRTGHGTLWFVASSQSDNDRVSYKFIEDTGTIVLTDGTCPDISKCTGMHPGAEWDGYWTRKTPG
jgi:hypothetical protein